jgi:hypothetical protein
MFLVVDPAHISTNDQSIPVVFTRTLVWTSDLTKMEPPRLPLLSRKAFDKQLRMSMIPRQQVWITK